MTRPSSQPSLPALVFPDDDLGQNKGWWKPLFRIANLFPLGQVNRSIWLAGLNLRCPDPAMLIAPQLSRETRAGFLFASPWLLGLLILFAWPFAISLYWSFCHFDLINPPEPAGWANYQRIGRELWTGQGFGLALFNTAYTILVSVPLSILLGVVLATWLSYDLPGRGLFRAVIFLPSIVPVVAASVLWLWLLNPSDGWLNAGLGWIGLPPQNWLTQSRSALSPESVQRLFTEPPANWKLAGSKDGLVLMTLWGVGNYVVIYLAAMGDIPRSLYEAAALDGAGAWRRWLHVTLPMLSPVILFQLVVGVIRGVQTFTNV
jgi:multiple sugar transport system permease protein